MIINLENRQEHVGASRSSAPTGTPHVKEIGPHDHGWEFYGRAADGGTYQVCQLCDARRVVDVPLVSALHRDWIEGKAKWKPDEAAAEPQVAVSDPVEADAKFEEDEVVPDRPRRGRPPKKHD